MLAILRPSGTTRTDAAKVETHERIVASASRLIRRKGLAAASVMRVMRDAGLTVGGFYAHFRSKRAMDAEVLRTTLAGQVADWLRGPEDGDRAGWLSRAVKRYLSPAHRDRPEEGCPMPAVLSELSRTDKATREVMVEWLERAVRGLAAHAPEAPGVAPRERALATLALCVGGLALSRALRGHPLSDEVLRASRKWALPETLKDRPTAGDERA